MTYYQLNYILRQNGYRVNRQTEISNEGHRTTGLTIDTAPIAMDDKMRKIRELLVGQNVRVTKFPNQAYILVEIVKQSGLAIE